MSAYAAASAAAEMASKPRLPWPWVVGFFALLIYFCFPAARYNFDGVACAIAVDLGDPRYLVHGNHVAYGAIGAGLHGLFRFLGYGGPAIFSLQILSSILGAIGVAGLCALLLNVGMAVGIAVAASLGLAFSRAWWVWSLEAQVYPLGAAFLVWTAAELLRGRPRPIAVGLLHCGAILGHVGHAMFAPAALAMLRERRARIRYLLALAASTALGYLIAVVAFYRPTSFTDLKVWLLGSAALPVDRRFNWQGSYSLENFQEWMKATLGLASGELVGGALLWLFAAWGFALAWRQRPRMARLAAFWLAGYALLYSNWQPYIVQYHYSDVPLLWILLACAAELGAKRVVCAMPAVRTAALAALAGGLGIWNWVTEIRPWSDPANNADLQRSLWIGRETPEGAWVVSEAIEQVYVPYFAGRKPLNLRYFPDAEALKRRVRELRSANEAVYAVPQVLPDWAGRALQELGWREISSFGSARLYSIH